MHSVDFDDQISPQISAPQMSAPQISALSRRLVPDHMWALVQPLIPVPKVRPQGGGRSRVGDRAVFVAVVYVLTSGCAWRRLPVSFGIAVPTAYRRFVEWNGIHLWERLHESMIAVDGPEEVQDAHNMEDRLVDWVGAIRDAAKDRAAFAT